MKSHLSIVVPGINGSDGLTGPQGIRGLPGPTGPPGSSATSSGTTYVRWGRTVCPSITGTNLVYDGLAAGTFYTAEGGGADFLCAARGEDAEYLPEATTRNLNHAVLYSVEYQSESGQALADLYQHNAPCAVCEVTSRSKQIMIPGRYTCPNTWTVEYSGWLMSSRSNRQRTTFMCLDRTPETVVGSAANNNGALLHHVEADCGTGQLPCPNYDATKELACVVCTK